MWVWLAALVVVTVYGAYAATAEPRIRFVDMYNRFRNNDNSEHDCESASSWPSEQDFVELETANPGSVAMRARGTLIVGLAMKQNVAGENNSAQIHRYM